MRFAIATNNITYGESIRLQNYYTDARWPFVPEGFDDSYDKYITPEAFDELLTVDADQYE
jgi:hypothetical protein